MAKRSNYERKPRAWHKTPFEAVKPLVGLLPPLTFCEPCAGDGRLAEHIESLIPGSLCIYALDIEPQADWVLQGNALAMTGEGVDHCQMIITNPPFNMTLQ